MALNINPGQRRGTSGSEGSDLRPGYRYDVDLRRLSEEERDIVERSNAKQEAIDKRVKSAKAAGEYRKRKLISQPTLNGKTPRTPGSINGVTLPSLGETFGPVGSTNYADKPQPFTGEVFY